MKNVIKLIRPYQWVKNVFVFLPLFFGGQLMNLPLLLNAIIMFAAYSMVASSIYCFNDIIDVEADRRHKIKCNRPIASGKISVLQGYVIMLLMLAGSLALPYFCLNDKYAVMVVLIYWLMSIAYCIKLKRIAIIDVFVLSVGFVLRIVAGGVATGIQISHWLVMMTFLITLFLGFAKRRDDVIIFKNTGIPPRHNTKRYNLTFLDEAITLCGGVMLVCYIMYTVSPAVVANFHNRYIYLTGIYVLLGLLRYIQLAVVDETTGDPTKTLLHDRFTQFIVVAWLLTFLVIIYLL